MERGARNLRNHSRCPQIQNVFNSKLNNSEVLTHVPASILKKIGNTQKLSCKNVMELPELMVNEDSSSELEQAKMAQEFQRLWETDFQPTGLVEPEKQSRSSAELKQETDLPNGEEEVYRRFGRQSSEMIINQEPSISKKDVWSDSSFLQNLNSFIFLENSQGRCLLSSEDYFSK